MKLSKNSKELFLFFTKNKHINTVKPSKRTNNILTELYRDIYEAYTFVNGLTHDKFYTITTKKIVHTSQISRPKTFNSNSFPDIVRKHIDEVAASEITYSFSLFNRSVKLIFTLEEDNVELKIPTFNKYVNSIVMWLYIVNQYASKQCSQTLTVYFYFTSLEKKLPVSNISILDEINVNTAFTRTCQPESEIVIFRFEEWLKVFFHETAHTFAIDFSDMNNYHVHKCILDIFKVKSDVNLFEAYAEFWAETMNALFCSFFSLKNKKNVDEFLIHAEFFMNFERTYSFFQLVKTLNFMGLSYQDLYSPTQHSQVLRDNLYKEKTNVLAYYVIKTIVLNNYQDFLFWCKTNNFTLMQFNKTIKTQDEFCEFIKRKYKNASMLKAIAETQRFISSISNKMKTPKLNYVLSNMRMSICELG
jgi:hypothetical protein